MGEWPTKDHVHRLCLRINYTCAHKMMCILWVHICVMEKEAHKSYRQRDCRIEKSFLWAERERESVEKGFV